MFHYTGFKGFQKEFPGTTLNECAGNLEWLWNCYNQPFCFENEAPYVEYADNRWMLLEEQELKRKVFDYSSPFVFSYFFRAIFDESQSLSCSCCLYQVFQEYTHGQLVQLFEV